MLAQAASDAAAQPLFWTFVFSYLPFIVFLFCAFFIMRSLRQRTARHAQHMERTEALLTRIAAAVERANSDKTA